MSDDADQYLMPEARARVEIVEEAPAAAAELVAASSGVDLDITDIEP